MPYSAVTQPRPWPLSQGGSRSSRLAVQCTCVLPNLIRHEPSACIDTARSMLTRAKLVGIAFGRPHGVRCSCCGLQGCRRTLVRCAPPPSTHKAGIPGAFDAAARFDPRLCQREQPHIWAHELQTNRSASRRRPAFPTCRSSTSARAPSSGRSSRAIWRPAIRSARATWRAHLPMTLSPASVRNVMSDLEAPGPHLCAAHLGRPPADGDRACACSSTACSRSAT